MMISELVVALLSLALSVVFLIETFSFPTVRADPGGLALFPRFFSVMTIIPAALLILSYFQKVRVQKGNGDENSPTISAEKMDKRQWIVLGLSLLFPALLSFAGFVIALVLFVFLLMKIMGGKTREALLFSFALSGVLYYVFGILVGLRMPMGILEYIL